MHTIMESYGTGDDFANIKDKKLYIGCTDQDSFEHVTFGPENSSIPISKAVRAAVRYPQCFDLKPFMEDITSRWSGHKKLRLGTCGI